MINILNLNKTFNDHIIFEDFSLSINDGEFVVVIGPSGCGKTTLLNIIGGIEDFDSGEVFVGKYDLKNKNKRQQFFQSEIGFLFQNFALIENKTVEDNLKIVRENIKNNISIDEVLDHFGINKLKKQKVYTLSGGEQQRVALARLLLKKCNVILADEPTGSLDEENSKIVIDALKELNKTGKTVIMVTHNKDFEKIGSMVINLESA